MGRKEKSSDAAERPLISCLCVTEDRAPFLPWLLWNYRKQAYEPRELVVVDSSHDETTALADAGATVIRCAPGTGVAHKRNLAVEAARGDLVTWFDDDDWQHPRKLSILAATVDGDGVVAGPKHGWFVDLARGRARPYAGRRVLFSGLGVRRAALEGIRFDETRVRAADTEWLAQLRRRRLEQRPLSALLTFWLCHGRNLSNPARRHPFPRTLAAVRAQVDAGDWGDTDAELEALRARVAASWPE